MTDALDCQRIDELLATRTIGHVLECYAEIDSTNRRAAEWARGGAPDGALVLADSQTAGRGRLGRRWHAPAGSSLLMSLILRPGLVPAQAQRAVMVCALGLVEAIDSLGLHAGIKWPNDVQLNGKKVAGLLAELGIMGQRLDYVVVGMGLNVNLDVTALPETLSPATSLAAELGRPVARVDLLARILERIEAHADALRSGGSPLAPWRARLLTLGQPVRVGTADEVIEGWAVDTNEDGALVVVTSEGERRTVLAGDVTLRGTRTGA